MDVTSPWKSPLVWVGIVILIALSIFCAIDITQLMSNHDAHAINLTGIFMTGLALVVCLMILLLVFSKITGIEDKTQALGLPVGSVRALLAFCLALMFTLFYSDYLGTTETKPIVLKFSGALGVTQNNIFFTGGALFAGQPIVNITPGVRNPGYNDTFNQLIAKDPVFPPKIGASAVGAFPSNWQNFQFGEHILYRLRTVLVPDEDPFSVFTLERNIPYQDEFGLRHLPPPFSIPIVLSSPLAQGSPGAGLPAEGGSARLSFDRWCNRCTKLDGPVGVEES